MTGMKTQPSACPAQTIFDPSFHQLCIYKFAARQNSQVLDPATLLQIQSQQLFKLQHSFDQLSANTAVLTETSSQKIPDGNELVKPPDYLSFLFQSFLLQAELMSKSHNFYGISLETQAKIYDRKKYYFYTCSCCKDIIDHFGTGGDVRKNSVEFKLK